ncbi:MAG: hypothetical protein HC936_06270 [Leptolyngbyaceae cyanobacterium SU_3_3]|nr:hypothetical protein [Leptolyngbyaceae cyanobacterium SU_3_3]
MSQLRNTPNQSPWGQRSLLRRLSYLSGVGLLSSGAAIAQTPSSTPQIVISSPAPTVSPTISASPTTSELDADLSLEQPIAREFSPKSEPAPLRSAPLPVEPTPQSPADYEAPTTIVFSDRSSGCEFRLDAGASHLDGLRWRDGYSQSALNCIDRLYRLCSRSARLCPNSD